MRKLLFASVMALVVSGGWAHANTVSGSLWHVPDATASNAIPANIPLSAPDVTFNVNSPLSFSAFQDTVGNWLASGGAFNVAENTAGTLASLMSNGNGVTGTGTLVSIIGNVSVLHNQIFTASHDDGLFFNIGALNVINDTGPTAPATNNYQYTGPSGTFGFQLIYGECCSGNAVLAIDLPLTSATPLPAALPLFASGLGAMGLFGWRRKRKKVAAQAAA